VDRFVERAAVNGVDVFRVFDAMNDVRNLETAIKSVKKHEKHAQGTMSYTVSPVHTLDSWLNMAKQIEEMGADSLCIKDMAGLLAPYTAYELISNLKKTISIPVHMQCHATTGLSTATYIKAVEAGIDNLDTAISSMSLTYGHTPTESMVAMLEGTDRDTGLNISLLEEIASYFREIRAKYAKFEGSLKGIDSRILVAQVPGGMLTNLENQLREQKATDRMDEVLEEIPRVREDLGFIPLVTPTSQIVGTQSVLNVLGGERYKTITKETEGVLKGEYGATPAEVNKELQERVLAGSKPITCRPADLLEPEFDTIKADLQALAKEKDFEIKNEIDDTLSYALFPHTALKFFMNRDNPDAFEPAPEKQAENTQDKTANNSQNKQSGVYTVEVDNRTYLVRVNEGGDVSRFEAAKQSAQGQQPAQVAPQAAPVAEPAPAAAGHAIEAPLSGIVHKVFVKPGEAVSEGDVLLVVEAMKMETEIKSDREGTVQAVHVSDGDAVESGDALVTLG
jgi:oxaloacetate decarboxylase alpha subunit